MVVGFVVVFITLFVYFLGGDGSDSSNLAMVEVDPDEVSSVSEQSPEESVAAISQPENSTDVGPSRSCVSEDEF